MIVYIICLWSASLMLGYLLAFNEATFAIAESITDTNSPRGFRDAITPPWSTNLTILSYAASIGANSYGWYEYGWLTGLGITLGFFFLVSMNREFLLPKSASEHYRRLIVSSLLNQLADHVKSDDQIRASSIDILLQRLGIDLASLTGAALHDRVVPKGGPYGTSPSHCRTDSRQAA